MRLVSGRGHVDDTGGDDDDDDDDDNDDDDVDHRAWLDIASGDAWLCKQFHI